jgi:hypothetical protein
LAITRIDWSVKAGHLSLTLLLPTAESLRNKEAVMRSKLFVILGLLLILAAAASGQTKITGTLSCGKPRRGVSHSVPSASSPAPGLRRWSTAKCKAKTATTSPYGDGNGAKVRSSGYHVSNLSNGERIYVRFQGNDTTMDGKPGTTEGTWSYTGGTGKFKGIKGKGTYKGKADSHGNMGERRRRRLRASRLQEVVLPLAGAAIDPGAGVSRSKRTRVHCARDGKTPTPELYLQFPIPSSD